MTASDPKLNLRPVTVECFGQPSKANGPFVFTCEHASRSMLGLETNDVDRDLLEQHWGWDIGALEVTKALVKHFDGVGVSTKFSRLIIDVNRHPTSDTLIVSQCDEEFVGFNQDLSSEERAWRLKTFHKQYHDTVCAVLTERLQRGVVHLVSIHSFTPVWRGQKRSTEIGVLFDTYADEAQRLADALAEEGFNAALNKPYSGVEGELMYSAHRHGQHHRIPYLELEIRQDLLASVTMIQNTAQRIARALTVFTPEAVARGL